MAILVNGLTIFGASLILHFIIWRIRLPQRQLLTLLAVFCCALIIGLISVYFLSLIFSSRYSPKDGFEYFYVALFDFSFVLTYLLSYPAIEVESPSFLIVLSIDSASATGLARASLNQIITDDLFVGNRIQSLVLGKMVQLRDGVYRITPKGLSLLKFFASFRHLVSSGASG